MDSTDAPVSIAVELATLTVSAFRYFAGAFRWGFVAMRGLPFIVLSFVTTLYKRSWGPRTISFPEKDGRANTVGVSR